MKNVFIILVLSSITFISCTTDRDRNLNANLLEKEKIIERVNKLFISTDNRDWEQVAECFTDSVFLDMTSLTGGKPQLVSAKSIVDAWDKGLSKLKAVHHQSGNFLVEIKEDGADLYCYSIATHYLPNKTESNIRTFVGSYDMYLVKNGEEWKINKFKYNLKYVDGNLELEKDI